MQGERDSVRRSAEGASLWGSHDPTGDTLRQTDRRDAATLERTLNHQGTPTGQVRLYKDESISQVKDRDNGRSL